MSQKFKGGDLVVLKSGSPTMTVREYVSYVAFSGPPIENNTNLICEWFVGTEFKSATFHQDSLEKEE